MFSKLLLFFFFFLDIIQVSSFKISLDPSLTPITPISYKSTLYKPIFESYAPYVHATNFQGDTPRWHGLVDSIHQAFQSHLDLVLNPSDLHLLIWQAIGSHIATNGEKLRDYFVSHQGKKTLELRRDYWIMHQISIEDWMKAVLEFSDEIYANLNPDANLNMFPTLPYSTQTPTFQASCAAVLMDAMSVYFDYRMMTMCGIPNVVLNGTLQDWKTLQEWTRDILQNPALKFMEKRFLKDVPLIIDGMYNDVLLLSQGDSLPLGRIDHWKNIYKYQHRSGGDLITGWILSFFEKTSSSSGAHVEKFTSGIHTIPFKWNYRGKDFNMCIFSGFGQPKFQDNQVYSTIGMMIYQQCPTESPKEINNAFDYKQTNQEKNTVILLPPPRV